jgi:hypothetical protein
MANEPEAMYRRSADPPPETFPLARTAVDIKYTKGISFKKEHLVWKFGVLAANDRL